MANDFVCVSIKLQNMKIILESEIKTMENNKTTNTTEVKAKRKYTKKTGNEQTTRKKSLQQHLKVFDTIISENKLTQEQVETIKHFANIAIEKHNKENIVELR